LIKSLKPFLNISKKEVKAMANLDRLMAVRGVWAAGEFTDDGKLVAYKGDLPEEYAAMAAEMCAANNAMAKMQCDGYTAFSGQEWTPLIGWALTGPKYSVCVVGNLGVFVKNDEVSFNEVFKALREEAGK
jgi:roadblock/LC7 domain-containing protein